MGEAVYAWGFILVLGLAAVLTPLVMAFAHRVGMVARPKEDRWHKKPTALLGGVVIFVAFMAGMLAMGRGGRGETAFLLGALIIFVVGLVDDIRALSPRMKMAGELLAAFIVVAAGIHFTTGLGAWVDWPLTLFWIVGITNAFNLLDNMDGLSAGTAAIAGVLLFIHTRIMGSPEVALAALMLSAASLGFLIYNFNPARIFMGDCGSLFLGFSLSVLTLLGTWTRYSVANLIWSLAGPVMFLTVPIMDTTLVSIVRALNGRPISQGGRDHTSHRLVAIGLTERQAVLVLYAVSLAFGLLGVYLNRLNLPTVSVIFIFMTMVAVYFAAFLAQVPVYGNHELAVTTDGDLTRRKATAILRRLVESVADVVVLVVAYLAAYLLRYDGVLTPARMHLVVQSLPVVLPGFLLSFWFFGLYRNLLRYTGVYDLVAIFKGVIVGAAISMSGLTLLFRFAGYPRTVFVIYVLLLLILIPANRFFLRGFHQLFLSTSNREGRKVAIYGAGDAGEMVLRELLNNRQMGYVVVGFIDDDPAKHGFSIHGVPILGPATALEQIAASGVEEVIVAMPSAPANRREEVIAMCKSLGLRYKVVERIV
ncbi:Glycosyl transferase, family 4 [Moorella glycerini]|uniref:Undecaprenyl-phosphate N-acetylglucosaminyl 1-phosphate transferase n=1 Tax=Neomoorella stamsii TaxID=1266720 RepID=A0A9X7P6U2_9FIRM|nr:MULTISPECIES: hypothetical protein [Moorella]PRR73806.1 putative undecaprenyl-phosphate N-acetylglucosaminyl 1-phosphate transferase [Moorella stamsii]CEP67176.1 Glycosyl transferase, family 4 [Moorella glycerini]